MRIKNIEIDFDFLDADDIDRFENGLKKVKKECELKDKQELTHGQVIRAECDIIDKFLDDVFGKGISERLFEGKKNLGEHIKVFEELVNEKNQKQKDLQNTLDRYQPNREQRRYDKFKGKR